MKRFFASILLLSIMAHQLWAATSDEETVEVSLTVNGGVAHICSGQAVAGTASASGCEDGLRVTVVVTDNDGQVVYSDVKDSPHEFTFTPPLFQAPDALVRRWYTVVARSGDDSKQAKLKVYGWKPWENFETDFPRASANVEGGYLDPVNALLIWGKPGTSVDATLIPIDYDVCTGPEKHRQLDTFLKPKAATWEWDDNPRIEALNSLVTQVRVNLAADQVAPTILRSRFRDDGTVALDQVTGPTSGKTVRVAAFELKGIALTYSDDAQPVGSPNYFTANRTVRVKINWDGNLNSPPLTTTLIELDSGKEITRTDRERKGNVFHESFVIDGPGRYQVKVENVAGEEYVESNELLFYSIEFSPDSLTWDWGNAKATGDGLNELMAKLALELNVAKGEAKKAKQIFNDYGKVKTALDEATALDDAYAEELATLIASQQDLRTEADRIRGLIAQEVVRSEELSIEFVELIKSGNKKEAHALRRGAIAETFKQIRKHRNEVAKIEKEIASLAKRADKITELIKPLKDVIVRLTRAYSNITKGLAATSLADGAAAYRAAADEAGPLRSVKIGKLANVLFSAIGVLADGYSAYSAFNRLDAIEKEYLANKAIAETHKEAIAKLEAEGGKGGAKKNPYVATTQSAIIRSTHTGITYCLKPSSVQFTTRDHHLPGVSIDGKAPEATYKWKALCAINGNWKLWGQESTLESTETSIPFTAYGNLGSQRADLFANVNGQQTFIKSISLSSTGMTQQRAMELARGALADTKKIQSSGQPMPTSS
jgi:hypothetical protein